MYCCEVNLIIWLVDSILVVRQPRLKCMCCWNRGLGGEKFNLQAVMAFLGQAYGGCQAFQGVLCSDNYANFADISCMKASYARWTGMRLSEQNFRLVFGFSGERHPGSFGIKVRHSMFGTWRLHVVAKNDLLIVLPALWIRLLLIVSSFSCLLNLEKRCVLPGKGMIWKHVCYNLETCW